MAINPGDTYQQNRVVQLQLSVINDIFNGNAVNHGLSEEEIQTNYMRFFKLDEESKDEKEAEWQDWDCVLCGKMCVGYGNNPAPLASLRDGRCCDECNKTKVIRARIQQMRAHVRAEEQRMDEEDEMDEESTVGVEESKDEMA